MVYVFGCGSHLYESVKQSLNKHSIAFDDIPYEFYENGELSFQHFNIDNKSRRNDKTARSAGPGRTGILLQLLYKNASECLLSTLFLADLLNIKTVCIPYIPYSRNKHLFDIFLKKLNTEVVTFDLHFFNAVSMLYEKVTNVPLRRVFRGEIKGDWDKAFVLAPDKGAIKRATEFAEDNGLPVFSASKERGGGGAGGSGDSCNVYLPPIDTSIFTRCFIVDDMIYSGKTILTTITGLNKIGISDISIFVTHVLPESQTLYRETFLEILRKASTFVTTNIHDVADMYSRPVAKASNFEGFLGAHEAQNRSVLNVREDSSIGATLKLQKERSFRNRSNSSAQQCVELEGGNIWQGLQPPTIIDVTNILVGIIQKNVTTQP